MKIDPLKFEQVEMELPQKFHKEKNFPAKEISKVEKILKSHIGLQWSVVYAKLVKRFGKDFLNKWLDWSVEENVSFSNGLIMGRNGPLWGGDFYIHPKTFVVCQANEIAEPKKEEKKPEPKIVTIGKSKFFRHKGIWYRVEVKKFDDCSAKTKFQTRYRTYLNFYHIVRDKFHSFANLPESIIDGNVNMQWKMRYAKQRAMEVYGELVYVTDREQANSRECKKIREALK